MTELTSFLLKSSENRTKTVFDDFRGTDGFGAVNGSEGWQKARLPKICHTYPTMMKLGSVTPYLKMVRKIYKSRDLPLGFCWHQHFFTENQQLLLHQEITVIHCILIHNFQFFWLWVFQGCFNKAYSRPP